MSSQNETPRVLLVRHGETEWTKSGRYTSTTDIELTPEGAAQVSSTAEKLVGAGKLLDPSRLAHIFVSPRRRATRTFELLMQSHSPAAAKWEKSVTYTEDIAEWDYGKYEGLTEREIRRLRKEKGLDLEREWDIWRDGCEGGESMQQVSERLDRLISQIREIQRPYMNGEKPTDVLLVAHGLVLRCFFKRWLGFSVDHPLRLIMDPGAITVLSYKNNNIEEPAFHIGITLPSTDETRNE
ncbi:hypothetical protein VTG60DRAFT_2816 [Thermothelomyces hinnuleus]